MENQITEKDIIRAKESMFKELGAYKNKFTKIVYGIGLNPTENSISIPKESRKPESSEDYEFDTIEDAQELFGTVKKNYPNDRVVVQEKVKLIGDRWDVPKFDGTTVYASNQINDNLVKFIKELPEEFKTFDVSFSVMGRTLHEILSGQLEDKVSDMFKVKIGYNYECHLTRI